MFKRTSKKKLAGKQIIKSYNATFYNSILSHNFIFQQDIVDDITSKHNRRIPTEDTIDLSSTVCAGVCYWTALSLLGLEKRDVTDFIEDIYDPKEGIKHTLGVSHIKFIHHIGKTAPKFYGLTLNPFREQSIKDFKDYGGYSGKSAEDFFKSTYSKINNTSSALKAILSHQGFAVISIQATFNNYSPNFHDNLVLGYKEENDTFLIFDPDARVYFDSQKLRPEEVSPVPGYPSLYIVDASYLDKHTYRQKPSPGGITIGLLKN